jgi:hypothetical protein
MLETIEGIYENGQVRLTEPPHNIRDRSQVLVTFINSTNIDSAKLSKFIDSMVEKLTPTNCKD